MEQPNQTQKNNFDNQFISGSLSYPSYAGPQQQYLGSEFQSQQYKEIMEFDESYKRYIIKTYGSYEEYLKKSKIATKGSVFDPTVDYSMDVTVITKTIFYKSDHISANEIILEALSGICSFVYIKKNGLPGKTNGTLAQSKIPASQSKYRASFFSPLPGGKIAVWDVYKQRWNMMFLKKIVKFVRDDTTDLE